jgi:NAD(P)-dependent dehydrogenase (short-subunit alcohol dehydrogenase family)
VNVNAPGIDDSGPFWERLGAEGRERLFSEFAAKAPARRVGSPDDLAAAALFAIANPFFTGTVLAVDGGGLLI